MTLLEKFEEVVLSNVKNDNLRDLILKHCCSEVIKDFRFIESDLVTSIFTYENNLNLKNAEIVIAVIIDNIYTDMETILSNKGDDLALKYYTSSLKFNLEALRKQFYDSIVYQAIREHASIDNLGKWKLDMEY